MSVLAGIARHAYPRAPMEVLERVRVTREGGLQGDFRGAIKPGGTGKRQVTVMAREAWRAAMADLGRPPLHWSDRRINLLSDGIELPRAAGAHLVIGTVVLEITGECDPCRRMDEVHAGLMAVLLPDWRAGINCRVRQGGEIALGDCMYLEEPCEIFERSTRSVTSQESGYSSAPI